MRNIKKTMVLLLVFALVSSLLCLNVFAYEYYDDEYDDEYYDNHPYEETAEDNGEFDVGKNLLIAFAVGLVIALIITGVMRSKMKTVRFQYAAQNYIRSGSMHVLRSSDMYLYSTVTKVPRPQNNNNKR